jgi:MinD-like ATPase involved in chromosome partitioning or flagellar assembly
MSSIITFYSYKGGVGRSMALANIAVLLARMGKRVMAVDWDLEAPGLDRYFSSLKLDTSGNGLLPLILDASQDKAVNYHDYLWRVRDRDGVDFAFLPSGRESDTDYATNLAQFDWRAFFSKQGGGDFVEHLREQWRADFDVVLIDSRTGLTDTGGICTIQLPDIAVPMFTANYQSLYGVRDVMRLAQHSRQRLDYDRMPLTIFPLPSRFGVS